MPNRRVFLGAAAALVAAPWVPFPKPDVIRGWDLARAKDDPIYFLRNAYYVFTPHETFLLRNLSDDGTEPLQVVMPRRHGKAFLSGVYRDLYRRTP